MERHEADGVTPIRLPIGALHRFYLLVWALLGTGISIALPFLEQFQTASQSQHLYTGVMLVQGQLPYADSFATGGVIYYALIALATYLGSLLWLLLPQFLALYLSSIFLYKIVAYLTKGEGIALGTAVLYQLFNLTLGFGGLYPIQWASPFILIALWYLTKYFAGSTKDEGFILYGFFSAFALMLAPDSLPFWLLAFLGIGIYNISQRHLARGFYQLLCIIFGTILVLYVAGYFILNLQILSPYLNQTLVYPWLNLARGSEVIWQSALFQLALVLASGLGLGALGLPFVGASRQTDKGIKWLIFLVFWVNFLPILASQTFEVSGLLVLLPFGLILTSSVLASIYQDSQQAGAHSRRRVQRQSFFRTYLKWHLYLPILGLLAGLAWPVYQGFNQTKLSQERQVVANYLTKESSKDQRIYIWDQTAAVYLQSQRGSSSQFALPEVNTQSAANQKILEDELLQNQASYLVINDQLDLPASLETNLKNNYTEVKLAGLSQLSLYQLSE